MSDIFISYAREDEHIVQRLTELLRANHWTAWWDHQISSRNQFPDEIEQALENCTAVVVIWSRASVKSRWVKEEANYALEHDKLVPVVIDGTQPPLGFQLIDTVNLDNWSYSNRSADATPMLDKLTRLLSTSDDPTRHLHGRSKEVGQLETLFDQQRDGAPPITLISGEAGIGKTSLAQEFRRLAEQAGFQCLAGNGRAGISYPFQSVLEALAPSLDLLDALPVGVKQPLFDLLSLGKSTDALNLPPLEQLELNNQRLFIALSRALLTFTRRQPLAFIFDDVQWLDGPSLSLIDHLSSVVNTPAARSSRILFLLAYRPDSLPEKVTSLVDQLGRRPTSLQIQLGPLSEEAARDLAEDICDGRLTETLCNQVLRVTKGNPLFISALLEDAIARGQIHWQHRSFAVAEDFHFQVPNNVAQIVYSRVGALSSIARDVLNHAVIWDGGFEIGFMMGLLSREAAEVVSGIETLEAARLVTRRDGAYQISHPLYQQIIYDQISYARRQLIHNAIANHLVVQPEPDPMVVAYHLVHADDLADSQQVKDYCQRGGQKALQMYAWDDAVRFFERYVQSEEASADRDNKTLAQTLHTLGAICNKHGRPEASIDYFKRALDLLSEMGDVVGRTQVLDDMLRWHINFLKDRASREEITTQCENALVDLGQEHPSVRGRLMETLATCYSLGTKQALGQEYARQALELALATNDFELAARLSTATALSHLQVLDPEPAAAAWENGIRFAQQIGDDVRRARCLQRLPMPYLLMGKFDRAMTVAKQAQQLNYALPKSGELSLAHAVTATVLVAQGAWAHAEDVATQATEIAAASGYLWAMPTLLGALVRKDVLRGDHRASAKRFELTDGTPFARTVAPLRVFAKAFAANELDRFCDEFASLVTDDALNLNNLIIAAMVIEASLLSGKPIEGVRGLLAELEGALTQGVVFSLGWPISINRAIGMCFHLLGDFEQAIETYQRTLAERHDHPAIVEVALLHALAAGSCAKLHATEQAEHHNSAAHASAATLGIEAYMDRLLVATV